jgi:threonyl-tRNA synthetase
MKVVLFHAREFETKVTGLSTRPSGIKPEPIKHSGQRCDNCVVVFVCVEVGDANSSAVVRLVKEIKKMLSDSGGNKVVLAPFAHLSNNLADSDEALAILSSAQDQLEEYEIMRIHFGSDKDLLLNVFGHPGNIRFRDL